MQSEQLFMHQAVVLELCQYSFTVSPISFTEIVKSTQATPTSTLILFITATIDKNIGRQSKNVVLHTVSCANLLIFDYMLSPLKIIGCRKDPMATGTVQFGSHMNFWVLSHWYLFLTWTKMWSYLLYYTILELSKLLTILLC